eukprot:gene12236-15581_t
MIRHLTKFFWNKTGPMGAPAVQAMGLARTRDGLDEPDVQLHFMPLAYNVEPETVSSAEAVMPKEPCISINVSLTRPKSRGRVELGEALEPVINHQLLGDRADVDTLIGAMKLVDRLFAMPALNAITLGDHVWDQRGWETEIVEMDRVCRPANLPKSNPGWDHVIIEKRGFRVAVFTVLGRTFMGMKADCPFLCADRMIEQLKAQADAIIVEIH